MESALYMRNQLLRDADWAGMAHSLEIRVPLVDATLLATTAGAALRDPDWGKQRLALAPSRRPVSTVGRRAKTGFTTPVAQWQAVRSGARPGRPVSGSLRPWSRLVFAGLQHSSGATAALGVGAHG